jgi:hypothetical protein
MNVFERQAVREIHKQLYDMRHGGPYDRGSADRYYGRAYNPHYFKGATHQSELVSLQDMSADEITAYTAGFNNETDRKAW